MVDLSSHNERLNYDNAVRMLIVANFKPANGYEFTREEFAKYKKDINVDEVTQGYLWTEAPLTVNQQAIQFPVVDTQQVAGSPITPTMRLLTMQDSFLIATWSYFLMNYNFTDGSQANVDFSGESHYAPITYSSYWNNNGTSEDLWPGADMFWVGAYLSLEVNKRKLIPYWDCYRHYKAPIMQATTGMYVPNILANNQNSHDGSVDGFYPVEPNVVVGGGRGNILKLNLAANIPSNVPPFNFSGYGPNFLLKAVVCMRGILLQNSTTLK